MTTKLVKWASNDGQIIKSGLLDGRRATFLPSVAEFAYDGLLIDGYLGNVGLKVPRRMASRVISAKKRSTWLSQEADVGVKWKWKRRCFFSHFLTSGVLWVA